MPLKGKTWDEYVIKRVSKLANWFLLGREGHPQVKWVIWAQVVSNQWNIPSSKLGRKDKFSLNLCILSKQCMGMNVRHSTRGGRCPWNGEYPSKPINLKPELRGQRPRLRCWSASSDIACCVWNGCSGALLAASLTYVAHTLILSSSAGKHWF